MRAIRSYQVTSLDDFCFSICDQNQLPGIVIKIFNFYESLKEKLLCLSKRNIRIEKCLIVKKKGNWFFVEKRLRVLKCFYKNCIGQELFCPILRQHFLFVQYYFNFLFLLLFDLTSVQQQMQHCLGILTVCIPRCEASLASDWPL